MKDKELVKKVKSIFPEVGLMLESYLEKSGKLTKTQKRYAKDLMGDLKNLAPFIPENEPSYFDVTTANPAELVQELKKHNPELAESMSKYLYSSGLTMPQLSYIKNEILDSQKYMNGYSPYSDDHGYRIGH